MDSDIRFCSDERHNVDLKKVAECFNIISKIEHSSILDTVSMVFSAVDYFLQYSHVRFGLCLASDVYFDRGCEPCASSSRPNRHRVAESVRHTTLLSRIFES